MGKGQILETILTRVSIIKTEFYSFVLEENQGTFSRVSLYGFSIMNQN